MKPTFVLARPEGFRPSFWPDFGALEKPLESMAPRVECIECKKGHGRLGSAPNKYCYKKKCKELGISRGHIKEATTAPPRQVRSPGVGGGGDVDDDMVPTSTFEISELKNVFGVRCALSRPRTAPTTAHSLVDGTYYPLSSAQVLRSVEDDGLREAEREGGVRAAAAG